jgi:hypothetical protein
MFSFYSSSRHNLILEGFNALLLNAEEETQNLRGRIDIRIVFFKRLFLTAVNVSPIL